MILVILKYVTSVLSAAFRLITKPLEVCDPEVDVASVMLGVSAIGVTLIMTVSVSFSVPLSVDEIVNVA